VMGGSGGPSSRISSVCSHDIMDLFTSSSHGWYQIQGGHLRCLFFILIPPVELKKEGADACAVGKCGS